MFSAEPDFEENFGCKVREFTQQFSDTLRSERVRLNTICALSYEAEPLAGTGQGMAGGSPRSQERVSAAAAESTELLASIEDLLKVDVTEAAAGALGHSEGPVGGLGGGGGGTATTQRASPKSNLRLGGGDAIRAAVFLASAAASCLNGQVLIMDAGHHHPAIAEGFSLHHII